MTHTVDAIAINVGDQMRGDTLQYHSEVIDSVRVCRARRLQRILGPNPITAEPATCLGSRSIPPYSWESIK